VSDATADRLQRDRNIWLATVRPDGRPHLAPVWFVFVDGAFWVGTGAASVKVRNLATNAAATVSLEDGNAPVVAECTGWVHPRPYPPAVVEAFASKYEWDLAVEEDADVGTVTLVHLPVRRWIMGGPPD
jgi:nitroimidazol reductase NimA-like FMN-containing flavoprotein (pyridoxamine 5'-phosphate oxidase superfamily)